MCFGWFIASGSLFLARPHLFPVFMRKTGALVLLGILPLILMIFWLFRVRFAARQSRNRKPNITTEARRHGGYTEKAFG
jgi:hypothetical protein